LSAEEFARLVPIARELAPDVIIECGGNLTLENVRAYAEAGADLISIGTLTNSTRAMKVTFQIQPV
jgi:nicotinate-nucleotide pyrophosphorylase (carboxylating)